jgi:hypothetical protein
MPLSMTDLSQIEKTLGSFSNDSASYIIEFKYLTQSYDVTWHDICVILSSTLTLDEKERVWSAAQELISLSQWALWLCHVKTHIGTIKTLSG